MELQLSHHTNRTLCYIHYIDYGRRIQEIVLVVFVVKSVYAEYIFGNIKPFKVTCNTYNIHSLSLPNIDMVRAAIIHARRGQENIILHGPYQSSKWHSNAWHQKTNHYLSQCSSISMSPVGVTRTLLFHLYRWRKTKGLAGYVFCSHTNHTH